ncbi:HNH endonuclease signature motif containing protein [Prauserella rugosa]|nr:HNH endonuclease signature motif containing protein [Prauserella rugosa]
MNGSGGISTAAAGFRSWRARVDGAEMTFLASLASDEGEWRGLTEELAPSLRVSPVEVEKRIRNAVDLSRRMPRVLEAMREGQVELYGARRILAVTSPLSDEHARQVDALLSDKLASAPATSWQPRNLAQHAARLVEKIDPGGQAERARMARAGRRVELDHGPNAQSRLTAELPSEVASACYARVDAMARRLRRDGESRTLDQLRADVTADLLLGNDPGVRVPEAAAMVYLHMPIDAALSMSDSGCELDGYGPIPAAVAREIMTNTDSVWRKVLCDPATGQPLDLGRSRRRPNAAIRELVRVRDRECVVPWCRRPARHCDLDHQREWSAENGPTSAANTAPRCRRHHRMKNAPGWITRHDPLHGTSAITTPHGSTYTGRRRPVLAPKPTGPDDPPF